MSIRSINGVLAHRNQQEQVFLNCSMERFAEQFNAEKRQLAQQVERAGVVTLELANDENHCRRLLATLAVGATALILSPGATEDERQRLSRLAGSSLICPSNGPGVLLPTSGSTGESKLVFRSEASLWAEAERYRATLSLKSGEHVVLLSPISHAYTLGWLFAGLLSSSIIVPIPPNHLAAGVRALTAGAGWAAMTPTLVRLLIFRAQSHGLNPLIKLRVMVGAGPVDDELESKFHDLFGVGLARNYGSSETGAICSGLEGLPAGCVGSPMVGIKLNVINESGKQCLPGEIGDIAVCLENSDWHSMGDLGYFDSEGRITITGRRSRSIRRSDQWIPVQEVEQAAARVPGVRNVLATREPGDRSGEEKLALHVEPVNLASFRQESFREGLQALLSTSKMPDVIRTHARLDRTDAGKVCEPRTFSIGSPERLLELARSYKRAELLFALLETGVLGLLDGQRSTTAIARETGLDLAALEFALEQAQRLGIITSERTTKPGSLTPPIRRLIEFEAILSRAFGSRSQIATVLKSGLSLRNFDNDLVATFRSVYQAAMHGEVTRYRVRFGCRLLKPAPAMRVLEISSGPGDYLTELLRADNKATGRLWQVGPLADRQHPGISIGVEQGRVLLGHPQPGEKFDKCVVFNAIHWAPFDNNESPPWSWLGQGGQILVDDIFLTNDADAADFGIDWLTHGGVAHCSLEDVVEVLQGTGMEITTKPLPGSKFIKLISLVHKCG